MGESFSALQRAGLEAVLVYKITGVFPGVTHCLKLFSSRHQCLYEENLSEVVKAIEQSQKG